MSEVIELEVKHLQLLQNKEKLVIAKLSSEIEQLRIEKDRGDNNERIKVAKREMDDTYRTYRHYHDCGAPSSHWKSYEGWYLGHKKEYEGLLDVPRKLEIRILELEVQKAESEIELSKIDASIRELSKIDASIRELTLTKEEKADE